MSYIREYRGNDLEKPLTELPERTKECSLIYNDQLGAIKTNLIKKPRVIIGKAKDADIQIKGWFAPSIAATIERHGNAYELVPIKRGRVIFKNKRLLGPITLVDGCRFIVRDIEFAFFSKHTKTS